MREQTSEMRILCFGDSNTFGYNPFAKDGTCFSESIRWTGRLQQGLGSDCKVLEEGLNNRTAFVPFENSPDGPCKSGADYLSDYLAKSENIDLSIIALGTNDLQTEFNADLKAFEAGLKRLIKLCKDKNPSGNILIIPPAVLTEDVLKEYGYQFGTDSIEKSQKVLELYKKIAEQEGCNFFDINLYAAPPSPSEGGDGLHYGAKEHEAIADGLIALIKKDYILPANLTNSNNAGKPRNIRTIDTLFSEKTSDKIAEHFTDDSPQKPGAAVHANTRREKRIEKKAERKSTPPLSKKVADSITVNTQSNSGELTHTKKNWKRRKAEIKPFLG